MWCWRVWCVWCVKKVAFDDCSLVLMVFERSRVLPFQANLFLTSLVDFQVCENALFYCCVLTMLMFWGGLQGQNCDSRGGFTTKVEIALSSLGEAVGRLHVGVFQASRKPIFSLLKLRIPWFGDHRIIKKYWNSYGNIDISEIMKIRESVNCNISLDVSQKGSRGARACRITPFASV